MALTQINFAGGDASASALLAPHFPARSGGMRGLYSLYALISTPPPNMGWFVLPGIVLVGSYLALSPFDAALTAAGVPAFILSVVLMHVALTGRAIPALREAALTSPKSLKIALGAHIVLIGAMLLSADPLFCQRVWTATVCLRIIMLASGLTLDRSMLKHMHWVGRGFDTGQNNAARWAIAGAFMLILINEATIAHGTPEQWILVRALSQPLVHALVYWTILATHPYDDEPET